MGRIVAAVGVQGWVRVKTFTGAPDALDAYAEWVVKAPEGWRYMALEEFAVRPNGSVAKLAGCDDRDAADRLRGAEVAVPREALEDEEGSLYQVDLIGLQVVDEAGAVLGKVDSFFEAGDTAVMVVGGTGRERMIPFVPAYVKAVDRKGGRVTVDWKADYDE